MLTVSRADKIWLALVMEEDKKRYAFVREASSHEDLISLLSMSGHIIRCYACKRKCDAIEWAASLNTSFRNAGTLMW